MWKFEPRKFWVFTGIVIGILVVAILGVVLFAAWKNSHPKPNHEGEPSVSISNQKSKLARFADPMIDHNRCNLNAPNGGRNERIQDRN